MATISFTTAFDLTLDPPQIIITDTTDYEGQGVDHNFCYGAIKAISPSGITFYNKGLATPSNYNVRLTTSPISSPTFGIVGLPIDPSTGLPELGKYIIDYNVWSSEEDTTWYAENIYTNKYYRPVEKITTTVDCVSPQFLTKDTTDYVIEGITPTFDHLLKLAYPNAINGSTRTPTTTTGFTITRGVGQFFQGAQTTSVSSGLTYLFTDNLTVIDLLVFGEDFTVDCTDICGVWCCVKTLRREVLKPNCCDKDKQALYSLVMSMLWDVQYSINCGKGDDVNALMDRIKAMLNCKDGCKGCGSAGSPVIGIGTVLNNVVVGTLGSPFGVEAVVDGSLTTYNGYIEDSFVEQQATNTTDITALQAAVAALQPNYKIYKANLTQTGVAAPEVTIIDNTLGSAIVWTYSDVGIYKGTLAGAFPLARTDKNIQNGGNDTSEGVYSIQTADDFNVNEVWISTSLIVMGTLTGTDEMLQNTTVTIIVKNP